MKITFIFSSLLLMSFLSFSQITITKSDIGSPDDTVRYSYAIFNNNSYQDSGANHTWDLSNLVAFKQKTSGYYGMSNVNLIYKLAFWGSANLASPREDIDMLGMSITESYSFYDKSNSDLRIVGAGGNINGAPIPLKYDDDDIIYRFPMDFGDLDSSDSHYSKSLASLGYIEQDLHRVNKVDGWGTIITPHDTYQCLRLKSTVYQSDSVYITSSNLGLRIPQSYTEYIWLAKGMDFPVAYAKITLNIGFFTYIDDYIPFTSIDDNKQVNSSISISPNPSSDIVKISSSENYSNRNISIMDISGKVVYSNSFIEKELTINVNKWGAGMYFVIIRDDKGEERTKLIVR